MKKLLPIFVFFATANKTMENERRIWLSLHGRNHHVFIPYGPTNFNDFVASVKRTWALDERCLIAIKYKDTTINELPHDFVNQRDNPLIIKIISAPENVTAKDYLENKNLCKKND